MHTRDETNIEYLRAEDPKRVMRRLTPKLKRVLREGLREHQWTHVPLIHREIERNAAMAAYIRKFERRGTLLVEWGWTFNSGQGVASEYAEVAANVPALKRAIEDLGMWAESEIWWRVCSHKDMSPTHRENMA